ncbi:hypothetical protein C1H46_008557 [Malus baccata]|uniref:At2g35280-like TPR domain-containing protein n=1 Tax=Malus baccata TaxID=106549 RepID=A0A540N4B8_MALBA|nr:hypothetical protein C1H46_008557 [Malus baccata]
MVGMQYFFRDNKEEFGIQLLKNAITVDHQVTTSVYSAILVCHGWDSKHEGLNLLYSLNRHNLGWLSVMECQERFQLCQIFGCI